MDSLIPTDVDVLRKIQFILRRGGPDKPWDAIGDALRVYLSHLVDQQLAESDKPPA